MWDWTGEVLQRVLEEFDYCAIAESKVSIKIVLLDNQSIRVLNSRD